MSRVVAIFALIALGALVPRAFIESPDDLIAVATTSTTMVSQPTTPPVSPEVLGPARALTDLDGWLQSDVTSIEELRGQVVVVQFWTFGCRNCKNTLPTLQALYLDYQDQGLEIVGVHSPEFTYEAEVANIEAALVDLAVTWPVALDTDKRNFHSWQDGPTGYWPRTFVIDKEGVIRFDQIGEGRYHELRATVEFLLDQ